MMTLETTWTPAGYTITSPHGRKIGMIEAYESETRMMWRLRMFGIFEEYMPRILAYDKFHSSQAAQYAAWIVYVETVQETVTS